MNHRKKTVPTLVLIGTLASIAVSARAYNPAEAVTSEQGFREAVATALTPSQLPDAPGRAVAEGSEAKKLEAALAQVAPGEAVKLVLVDPSRVQFDADGNPVMSDENIKTAITAAPSLTVSRDQLRIDEAGRVTLAQNAQDAVRQALNANRSEPTEVFASLGAAFVIVLIVLGVLFVLMLLERPFSHWSW